MLKHDAILWFVKSKSPPSRALLLFEIRRDARRRKAAGAAGHARREKAAGAAGHARRDVDATTVERLADELRACFSICH